MATAFYDRAVNMADRMIRKYGKVTSAYLRRDGTDYPVAVVRLDYRVSDIDGNLIRRTDKRILMPAKNLTVAPDMETDQLVIGSKVYQIKNITTLEPGDVAVLYDMQVRQ